MVRLVDKMKIVLFVILLSCVSLCWTAEEGKFFYGTTGLGSTGTGDFNSAISSLLANIPALTTGTIVDNGLTVTTTADTTSSSNMLNNLVSVGSLMLTVPLIGFMLFGIVGALGLLASSSSFTGAFDNMLDLFGINRREDYNDVYSGYHTATTNYPSYTTQSQRNYYQTSSLLSRVLKSIDPVESAFNYLSVDSPACRKRAICEMHHKMKKNAMGAMFIKYMSPHIYSLGKYRDAMLKKDCAASFPGCQTSLLEMLSYSQRV